MPHRAMIAGVVRYRYRASRGDGTTEHGVLEAASREDAAGELMGRGLFPLTIDSATELPSRTAALAAAELGMTMRQLATLLESGLPIARAIVVLEDLAPVSWRPAFPSIVVALRNGSSLSTALRDALPAFPPAYLGLLMAGEASGDLTGAARRAADLAERSAAARATLVSALVYPVVLAMTGLATVGLLVGIVLPRFSLILADMGQALPPTTRMVLEFAGFARAATLPVAIGGGGLWLAWRKWVRTKRGGVRWAELMLWRVALPDGPVIS